MTETLITTSSQYVGETSNNSVNFTFTPVTPISYEKGSFVIEAPVWASQFDSLSGEMIEMSPLLGLEPCSASQFNTLTSEVVGSILTINYTYYLEKDNESILITCNGFFNPITPTVQEGYSIKIYNKNNYQINEALSVSFDGTSLEPSTVPAENFNHVLTNRQIGENSTLELQFSTDIPISSTEGCYVKVTFPA